MKFGLGKKKKEFSDEELIEQYQRTGNTYFVGELFQRYTRLVSALSLKYMKNEADAEDAVMEVFELVMRDLKTHDVKNFNAWVYSVARYHCLKKKRQNTKEREGQETIYKQGGEEDPLLEREEALLKEAQLTQLNEAMSELSEEQKQCVELFYLQEKSYKEVAEITGYSMKQVKSYLQNGKRNLKGHLTKLDG